MATLEVGQFRVTREIAVDAGMTLSGLNEVLQVAFAWEDCHRDQFTHRNCALRDSW
ncbi:IS1096 element passenger TnpR family protein [Corynebacterium striatum]